MTDEHLRVLRTLKEMIHEIQEASYLADKSGREAVAYELKKEAEAYLKIRYEYKAEALVGQSAN